MRTRRRRGGGEAKTRKERSKTRIDVAEVSAEDRDDEKRYKKETGEFVFDGGGNIDPVHGTAEKETRQRGNSTGPGRV